MIQPVKNNIVFKPFISGNTTKSGFVIPDSCKKELNKGTIVAVGNGTKETPMQFKGGEIAWRVKDWGEPFELDGEKYYLMNQDSILATV